MLTEVCRGEPIVESLSVVRVSKIYEGKHLRPFDSYYTEGKTVNRTFHEAKLAVYEYNYFVTTDLTGFRFVPKILTLLERFYVVETMFGLWGGFFTLYLFR